MILIFSESWDVILLHILFSDYYILYLFFRKSISSEQPNIGTVFLPTVYTMYYTGCVIKVQSANYLSFYLHMRSSITPAPATYNVPCTAAAAAIIMAILAFVCSIHTRHSIKWAWEESEKPELCWEKPHCRGRGACVWWCVNAWTCNGT